MSIHCLLSLCTLQSMRSFGERVLGIFLATSMAASFDLNGRRRLGRERNLYQGGERQQKERRGAGAGGRQLTG